MQARTLQTISTARTILAMGLHAVDEDQYCDVLCALNDIVVDDVGVAGIAQALARDISEMWDKAVKHDSADEVRLPMDVVDEARRVIERASRH